MRFAKFAGAAGLLVIAGLVGGTLIGGVLAAPRGAPTAGNPTSADRSSRTPADDVAGRSGLSANAGKYCDVFMDTIAATLGVERDALLPAAKDAAKAAIDAAVAAGGLDSDRAAAIREQVDQATGDGCGMLGARLHRFGDMHPFAPGVGRGFIHADVLNAATDALKLDRGTLFSRLAHGDSLRRVAADQGVQYATLTADILAALDADLKAAVKNGLDQERATAFRDRISAWLDSGGVLPGHRFRGMDGIPLRPDASD